ncbi:DUF4394 domain-containing protein [Ferruginibacter sp. HRS2-29]|uniref:DUF4394 domain-containing protein n=1 Tax=Ferruginibacter sp. HRS2-29 TaxID=2487334 RepID=UPI0020CECBB6|nr:DUF4394 domain-containing protein [Ferruginibacter sp. HRS2-29]
MKTIFSFFRGAIIPAVLFSVLLTGCDKDDTPSMPQKPDVNFFGLGINNRLLVFNAQNTASPQTTLTISGLQPSETILGIDFRPNTRQLFGIGSSSRLYIINTQTGAATAVGSGPFTPAISGTSVAFDFNPTVDRIRLVTSSGQNLRLNPETGTVAATDGNINGQAGAVVSAVAYTQSRAGATSTILFDIDVTSDKLFRQDPPNAGTLVAVGDLGVDVVSAGGFDISSDSAYALASMTVGSQNSLYTINLTSGAATKVGDFSEVIIGLAIPTDAVGYALTTTNELQVLNLNSGTAVFTKTITGLQAGENLLGIDMRPATGQLFGLGSTSRLYTININTGIATQVGTGTFSTLLNGTGFGFDFNPTVDRIRVVSNTGQNLRLNPLDGTVAAVDGAINPGASVITGAAYTNNFAGAATTVLFDIDSQTDRLVKQDPPNAGTIVDIGALGINVDAANGFDIAGGSNTVGYAIFTVGGAARLYSVNLATGAAAQGPQVNGLIRGFAIGLGL